MNIDKKLDSSLEDLVKDLRKVGRGPGARGAPRTLGKRQGVVRMTDEDFAGGRKGRKGRVTRGAGGRPLPAGAEARMQIDTLSPGGRGRGATRGGRGRGSRASRGGQWTGGARRINRGNRLIQKTPTARPAAVRSVQPPGMSLQGWMGTQVTARRNASSRRGGLQANTALSRRQMGRQAAPPGTPSGMADADRPWLHRINIVAEMAEVKQSHQASKMGQVPLPASMKDKSWTTPATSSSRPQRGGTLSDRFAR